MPGRVACDMAARLILAATLTLALLASFDTPSGRRPMDRLPRLVLWAWERPVDLRALPPDVGVAFLAQTITATARAHVVLPRRQPLHVAPATPLIAVTRIETPAGDAPSDRVDEIARAIASTADAPARRRRAGGLRRHAVAAPDVPAVAARRAARPAARDAALDHRAGVVVHARRLARRSADRRSGADAVSHGSGRAAAPRHGGRSSARAGLPRRDRHVARRADRDSRERRKRVYVFNPEPLDGQHDRGGETADEIHYAESSRRGARGVAATTAYVLACGPFLMEYPRGADRSAPRTPTQYSRGSVGVVRPRFARRYLVQAYRRFSGQRAAARTWPRVSRRRTTRTSRRPPVAAVDDAPRLHSQQRRRVRPDLATASRWIAGWATATSRFRTASTTPSCRRCAPPERACRRQSARRARRCASGCARRTPCSRTAREAHSSCRSRRRATADALTRADRAYQTAAAYFYATRVRRGGAAASARSPADATSPWRPYGRYLAARALIRSGTTPDKLVPEPLLAAQAELRGVLAGSGGRRRLHASARGLLDFVEAHVHPIERLRASRPP